MVIMMSDGLLDACEDGGVMAGFIRKQQGENPKQIAQRILDRSKALSKDDQTVVAFMLCRR